MWMIIPYNTTEHKLGLSKIVLTMNRVIVDTILLMMRQLVIIKSYRLCLWHTRTDYINTDMAVSAGLQTGGGGGPEQEADRRPAGPGFHHARHTGWLPPTLLRYRTTTTTFGQYRVIPVGCMRPNSFDAKHACIGCGLYKGFYYYITVVYLRYDGVYYCNP